MKIPQTDSYMIRMDAGINILWRTIARTNQIVMIVFQMAADDRITSVHVVGREHLNHFGSGPTKYDVRQASTVRGDNCSRGCE